MIPYVMLSDIDCGPAALHSVTGLAYRSILSSWPGGWSESNDRGPLGVPNDTPWDHFALLADRGIPFRIVTCGDILEGRAPRDRTLVLMHAVAPIGPEATVWERLKSLVVPIMGQHWVIFHGVSPEGNIGLWTGNPRKPLVWLPPDDFAEGYSAGWPACAYCVGEGSTRLSWWQRLVAWLSGRFI